MTNKLEKRAGILRQGDGLILMRDLHPNSVHLVLTDPPYVGADKTRADWDKAFSLTSFWAEIERILHPSGAVVIFGNEPFSSGVRASNLPWYKYDVKWVKNRPTGFANANYRPLNKYEDIMVFSPANASAGGKANAMTYNPQGLVAVNKTRKNSANRMGKISDRTNNLGTSNSLLQEGSQYVQKFTNYPSNVVTFGNDSKTLHPTQKPIKLLEYLVRTYSHEGETVLDCFMGSGSTCVACVNTGRRFIGFELDAYYYKAASKWVAEITGGNDE